MNDNVSLFFDRYDADAALRERVAQALAMYPGSLEVRAAVAQEVLLPIADEEGLPFTLEELRAYETRRKLRDSRPDENGEMSLDEHQFWLVGYGWEEDENALRP